MANIGEPKKERIYEPIPETVPVEEPSPPITAPVEPVKEPEPV